MFGEAMITADVSCRLLERMEGMSRHGNELGQHCWTITYPTQGEQRISESYLRRLYGNRLVDTALRAKVLIRDPS